MPASLLLPRISTTVRFTAAALLAPQFAGAWAERLFLTPPRRSPGLAGLDLIDARAGFLEHRGRQIATWEWGWKSREAPLVLLAHGWGGHAAQMRAFAFPLLAAGYRVLAFDQPAHGLSEGRLTGLPDFAAVLAALALRDPRTHGVVGHSLGGAAVALALASGLKLNRAVLIGASLDVAGYTERFARWHRLPEAIRAAMQAAIEERYGVRWEELALERLAPRLSSPALVVHDREDALVPWQQGERLAQAWRGACLLLTDGLGHGRILRDAGIAQAAADFIAGRSEVGNPARPYAPQPAPLY